MLRDAEFVVSQCGWERSIRLGRKTVHAFVRGYVTDSGMGTTPTDARMPHIRYDRKIGMFVHELTALPARRRQVRGAMVVALNDRGMFGAYLTTVNG